jgi:hypothetical protein
MTGKAIWLINFELKDLVEMNPIYSGQRWKRPH